MNFEPNLIGSDSSVEGRSPKLGAKSRSFASLTDNFVGGYDKQSRMTTSNRE